MEIDIRFNLLMEELVILTVAAMLLYRENSDQTQLDILPNMSAYECILINFTSLCGSNKGRWVGVCFSRGGAGPSS